jgi:Flp pilus assembly pilin Flp
MIALYQVVLGVAAAIMIAGLVIAIKLVRLARGGMIGRVARALLVFIIAFLGGYIAALWLPSMEEGAASLLVGFVFLFGAVFVVIVLRLVQTLVSQVFDELGVGDQRGR